MQIGSRLKWNKYFVGGLMGFALCCYQDCPTVEIVGEIARSPIFFFFPFLILADIFVKPNPLYSVAFIKINRILNIFIAVLCISCIVNLFIWLVIKRNGLVYLGENLLVKCIKQVIYYVLFLYIFRFFYICFTYRQNFDHLNVLFFSLIVFNFVILILEVAQMPYAFGFLHAEPNPYFRVRLLTMESSTTGGLVILLYTGMLITAKKKYEKITAHVFLACYCAFTLSKMFLIVFPVSIILLLLFKSKKIKPIYLLLGLTAVISVVYYFLLPFMVETFAKDLEEYTSSVTRSTSFVTGIMLGFKHLIGTGGLYPYYFLKQMPESTHFILGLLDSSNTTELESWGIGDDKFISAGSTLGEWGMLIGPIGFYLFYKLIKTLYKATINNYILFGVIYFTITSTLTETIITRVTWPIFFALVAAISDKGLVSEKIKSIQNSFKKSEA